jgi:hypothetical protein
LFFGDPVNQSQITEDLEASTKTTGAFLSCVVAIAGHVNGKVFAQRLRHGMWNNFFYITIELGPIIGGEGNMSILG